MDGMESREVRTLASSSSGREERLELSVLALEDSSSKRDRMASRVRSLAVDGEDERRVPSSHESSSN
jgi:hypothetical protein